MGGEADPLAGRVAVVTGGAGDIGRAVAAALRERGARVALCDLAPALERGRALGVDLALACDVTQAGEVDTAFAAVESALGPVELLVNAAGGVVEAPVAEMPEADWDAVIAVHLKGT